LTGEKRRVQSASRTDVGVHAKGQVVCFRTTTRLPPPIILRALNHYLPDDVAVREAFLVEADFNVRGDAISREYEYRILNSTVRSPLNEKFVYQVAGRLNIRMMNKVSQLLKGKHNFASFASALSVAKCTFRTVHEAKFIRKSNMVIFKIIANSFLRHQVRNTVGLLIKVGLGSVNGDEFRRIMDARKIGLAGPAAPPCGLYLMKVNYPFDLELEYENVRN
jgi:tRNA pseudouridine38-40 synthase